MAVLDPDPKLSHGVARVVQLDLVVLSTGQPDTQNVPVVPVRYVRLSRGYAEQDGCRGCRARSSRELKKSVRIVIGIIMSQVVVIQRLCGIESSACPRHLYCTEIRAGTFIRPDLKVG